MAEIAKKRVAHDAREVGEADDRGGGGNSQGAAVGRERSR